MYLIDQFDGFNCQICSNLTSSFDLDVIMTTFKQIFDFDSGHDPYYLILQWIIIYDLVLKGIHKRSEIGFLTFYEHYGHFEVGENYKKPVLPIWIVCSESHYSILFSANFSLASQHITANSRPFDLIYYDELARQADDIILTVEPGKYQEGGQRGMDGR